jgi:hypothetical protein
MKSKGLKVIHALPGRVRLKVPKVKGNQTLAPQAEKMLAQVPGIKQVEAKAGIFEIPRLAQLFRAFPTGALIGRRTNWQKPF